nr:uncharacterized protein LOC113474035 [Ciona intestinalis]|eukprot:XP_026690934.1 uncharacterized protein LOC113474035 [Ciona intestinalis]
MERDRGNILFREHGDYRGILQLPIYQNFRMQENGSAFDATVTSQHEARSSSPPEVEQSEEIPENKISSFRIDDILNARENSERKFRTYPKQKSEIIRRREDRSSSESLEDVTSQNPVTSQISLNLRFGVDAILSPGSHSVTSLENDRKRKNSPGLFFRKNSEETGNAREHFSDVERRTSSNDQRSFRPVSYRRHSDDDVTEDDSKTNKTFSASCSHYGSQVERVPSPLDPNRFFSLSSLGGISPLTPLSPHLAVLYQQYSNNQANLLAAAVLAQQQQQLYLQQQQIPSASTVSYDNISDYLPNLHGILSNAGYLYSQSKLPSRKPSSSGPSYLVDPQIKPTTPPLLSATGGAAIRRHSMSLARFNHQAYDNVSGLPVYLRREASSPSDNSNNGVRTCGKRHEVEEMSPQ